MSPKTTFNDGAIPRSCAENNVPLDSVDAKSGLELSGSCQLQELLDAEETAKRLRLFTHLDAKKYAHRGPLPSGPVVYVLLSAGEVIYVGATKSLRLRLAGHRKTKRFDAVRFTEVNPNALERAEAEWIVRLRPPLNVIDCRVLQFFGAEDTQRLFTYCKPELRKLYRDRRDVADPRNDRYRVPLLAAGRRAGK